MVNTSVHPDETAVVRAVEDALAELREARPRLESRIQRAEAILVQQLSGATNGSRPIKVRLHSDGTKTYRVRSGSKLTRLYEIEPASWRCSCPDAQRRNPRGGVCKHAISVYALKRAGIA